MKIGIIDTGICNIRSIEYALYKLNAQSVVLSSYECDFEIEKIILPGVGSFDHAMKRLEDSGLKEIIIEKVLEDNLPILGICLGMQLFANSSEEGSLDGLGLIKGEVLKLKYKNDGRFKVPNVGWSYVSPISSPFREFYESKGKDPRFYFVHSYHLQCHDEDHVAMKIHLDKSYCAAVKSKNIWGAQFHPEKSHNFGLEFLNLWLKS